MNGAPGQKEPKKPKAAIWLVAVIGLVLINLAVRSFVSNESIAAAWVLLLIGIALLGIVVWRSARKQ